METFEIYGIVNLVNNKVYIGQTRRGYRKRFIEHLCPKDNSPVLNRAIKKYGKENFECELLDITHDQNTADEKEKLWIAALKTYERENGYNLAMGGCGGRFSDEVRKKMSESHKGEKNSFYGKHHTAEARRRMSESRKGLHAGDKHPRAKKVRCVETGEVFTTLKEASEKYHIGKGKISSVCRKQYGRKTAGGYHWEYE